MAIELTIENADIARAIARMEPDERHKLAGDIVDMLHQWGANPREFLGSVQDAVECLPED